MATTKQPKSKKAQQPNKGGRPARFENSEALEAAISKYFEESTPKSVTEDDEDGKTTIVCDKQGRPVYTQVFPTVAGLAHSLGYASRQSIFDLKQDERYSYVIKRALLWIESLHEQNLAIRDKPTGDIFWLKNYGWSDHPLEDGNEDNVLEVVISDRRKR